MSTDYGDCDPIDASKGKYRRARKDHKCSACREVIRRGDLYYYMSWVFDHSADDLKRCARCQLMYEHLSTHRPEDPDREDEGVDWYLDCGHGYEEVYGKPPPDEIAALAFLTPAEAQARINHVVSERHQQR